MRDCVPVLLNLRQVAECFHVSPHTVRKWVKQGRLQPIRLCRRLLFGAVELNRFVSAATNSDKPAHRLKQLDEGSLAQ